MRRTDKGREFKMAYGKCPECGKSIARVGLYNRCMLKGFLGANCPLCGFYKKAVMANFEKVEDRLPYAHPKHEYES